MLTGENGILTQANKAKIEQSHGAVKDALALAYNEWQIEVRTADTTRLASKEVVTIKGKEEKSLAGTSSTFLEFLENNGYIKEGTTDVLDVEELTGGKQALGNGDTTDIYKIEEQDGKYVVNYIEEDNSKKQIWSIGIDEEEEETGEVTLEPDTGKEELILVYNVQNGDTIELPYYLQWFDGENENSATFNFTVDWGDGTTENITNADIATKAIHTYNNLEQVGELKIKISGTYESIATSNESSEYRQGYDKLVRVEQWGTTGIKTLGLMYCINLTQLATPTESSFKDLASVSLEGSGITSIPDKLFANCSNITSFYNAFDNCTNLTTIGNYAFANCSNVTSFGGTFDNCTNLTTIGDYAFANCSNVTSFGGTFDNCTNLTTIGDYAFANCSNVTSFESVFYGLSNLTTIGDYAFANCSNVTSFHNTFSGCSNLETIGEHMFAGCTSVESYRFTFIGCGNLTGKAPKLWLTGDNSKENGFKGTPDGYNCFMGCEGLENYNEIPEYWKYEPM